EELFSTLPGSSSVAPFRQVSFPVLESGSLEFTLVPDAVQNSVAMGIPAIGRNHPDYIPLCIAVPALGGYFGSRLTMNIREEKGLTYGITASLMTYPDAGFVIIESDTDPANGSALIDEVRIEIERLKDPASFSPDELTRLRRHILSDLARITDTTFSRMMYLQSRVTMGDSPTGFADLEAAARLLSADSIAETASRYLDPDRLVISIAGAKY
ncbi:MAG: insulinase family protein, partial [Duncaniella sp.]|nr:insulinase family protein [Duncaniella sp.]